MTIFKLINVIVFIFHVILEIKSSSSSLIKIIILFLKEKLLFLFLFLFCLFLVFIFILMFNFFLPFIFLDISIRFILDLFYYILVIDKLLFALINNLFCFILATFNSIFSSCCFFCGFLEIF